MRRFIAHQRSRCLPLPGLLDVWRVHQQCLAAFRDRRNGLADGFVKEIPDEVGDNASNAGNG